VVVVILVVLAATGYAWFKADDTRQAAEQKRAVAAAVQDLRDEAASVGVTINLPSALKSKSYILLQRSDYNRKFERKEQWANVQPGEEPVADAFMHERIRLSKAANIEVYPASMTKMLTTLVFVERIPAGDYDKEIEITQDDMKYLYEDGASVAGFEIGEKVKIGDLLYGVMLPSGAECTAALADYVAGGQDEFVELMNERAQAIGMNASSFSNPIGLHDDETYTTVSDMALLLDYAIRNDRFYEIITTQVHRTDATNKHPDGLKLTSTLYQQGDITLKTSEGEILGGKTGYTSQAGQCLASYMEKGGERFILVTAAAMPEDFHKQALHIKDMLSVFDALEVTRSGKAA
jgi:D-alanyl-D-alanine carboxypeptidase (penicillin-binding protein 5/6)